MRGNFPCRRNSTSLCRRDLPIHFPVEIARARRGDGRAGPVLGALVGDDCRGVQLFHVRRRAGLVKQVGAEAAVRGCDRGHDAEEAAEAVVDLALCGGCGGLGPVDEAGGEGADHGQGGRRLCPGAGGTKGAVGDPSRPGRRREGPLGDLVGWEGPGPGLDAVPVVWTDAAGLAAAGWLDLGVDAEELVEGEGVAGGDGGAGYTWGGEEEALAVCISTGEHGRGRVEGGCRGGKDGSHEGQESCELHGSWCCWLSLREDWTTWRGGNEICGR